MGCNGGSCKCKSSAGEVSLTQRLADMGLELPEVAVPLASYVPAVCFGHTVYTSGQLPLKNGELVLTGKLGCLTVDEGYECAKQCALNALAAAARLVGGLDRISDVVKVTGFVNSDPDFTSQPAVINGASDFFAELFGRGHARSAVGVAALPLDAPVEVEVIFAIK